MWFFIKSARYFSNCYIKYNEFALDIEIHIYLLFFNLRKNLRDLRELLSYLRDLREPFFSARTFFFQ